MTSHPTEPIHDMDGGGGGGDVAPMIFFYRKNVKRGPGPGGHPAVVDVCIKKDAVHEASRKRGGGEDV